MSEEQNALAEKYGCNGNCATCTDVICALGGAGQIDKIDHPEPKPRPDHIIKDASEVTAIYDFEGTGKQSEQPEMKRIEQYKTTDSEGSPMEVDVSLWAWDILDSQLSAGKSHCAECMARQEAETKKMSDLYFETRVLLGKKIGEVEQLKSEHVQAYKDWEGATMKAEKLIKEHYEAEIASLKSQLAEKGK